jgi:methylisocitrate lyase
MTEIGKSPWISDDEFESLGYALVIHPATTFRLAARAIKDALMEMKQHGNQETLQRDGKLMPRAEIDGYLIPNL